MQVFKVLRLEEAEVLDRTGEAPLSPADGRDGYVHLSTREQLVATLDKHFGDVRAVRLLLLDGSTLGDALKWEPARGGELFPHLYGRIRAEHVVQGWQVGRVDRGRFRLPVELVP